MPLNKEIYQLHQKCHHFLSSKEKMGLVLEKKLHFPASPAFVNNFKQNKEQSLNKIVEYCLKKNIPFEDQEDRFYKVNWVK